LRALSRFDPATPQRKQNRGKCQCPGWEPQLEITVFPLPSPGRAPGCITRGPDGNLWFTECGREKIARSQLPPVARSEA
jgi:hypothetical protein